MSNDDLFTDDDLLDMELRHIAADFFDLARNPRYARKLRALAKITEGAITRPATAETERGKVVIFPGGG